MLRKINCYSHYEFNDLCEERGWNDDKNPPPSGIALISICCTPECARYWLEEDDDHWFKEEHPNVLNLNFDDIPRDQIEWKGHIFYGLTKEDAKRCFDFIERVIPEVSEIWIHCRAGQSQSQGVVRYILDCYSDQYELETRNDNPCLTPNIDVVAKLKRCYVESILKEDISD